MCIYIESVCLIQCIICVCACIQLIARRIDNFCINFNEGLHPYPHTYVYPNTYSKTTCHIKPKQLSLTLSQLNSQP